MDGESEQRPGTGNEVLLGRFIVPDGVNKVQAIRVVEAAPMDYRQLLLDELAGHMRSKRKNIDSPLGFLHTITRKAIKGTLVATMANEVARVRQAHAEAARREVQGIRAGRPNSGAPGDSSSAVVTPGLSANAESERAKLRALRSKLASKAARGSAMRIAGTDASGGQHDE
ncbi:MAG: hypothetical protein JF606_29115 [Burkholderiales bacterium]|nr:hypothetical protein [Burkholderiales bacterium]